MSTATLEIAAQQRTKAGDELDHLYCCDPDLSLCGLDITEMTDLPDFPDDDLCIVCREMGELPCEKCGY